MKRIDQFRRRVLAGLLLQVAAAGLLMIGQAGPSLAAEADLEKELQTSLEKSGALAAAAVRKLAQGQDAALEIRGLKTLAENVRITHLLLEERFRLREEKARTLGASALSRQQAMAEGYRAALTEYLSLLDRLPAENRSQEPGAGSQEIHTLQLLLDKFLPKKKRPILGSLPYKHLNLLPTEPASAPEITPAYLGGNRTVGSDDTAATPEAPHTNKIAALAQSLNWNPVSIYEYVKNNIDTEWYWGCMKGAEETLHQKSGNDCDQATLLTALLRASGFPTRYVRGVIEFFPDIERATNLTGIDDPIRIAELFQKAGIPYKPVIQGGRIANIRFEHIWVESRIPYANYRGAIIDEHGKTWLGLDTSIKVKGYEYRSAKDLFQEPGVPSLLAGIRDEYLGLITAPTTSTPLELNQTPLEFLKARLTTVDRQLPDFTLTRTLIPENMKILPASLQFTLVKATHEYASIPDGLKHKVKLSANSIQSRANGEPLFEVVLDAMQLSNHQVAVSFEPETVQDQEMIHAWGGLDNTPAYLVRLRPVLKVDGERIVVGRDGLPRGADYDLTIELFSPSANGGTAPAEAVTNTMIAGDLSVIGIVSQKSMSHELPATSQEKDAERLLYEAAQHYIDRWNQAEDELASLLHLTIARPLPTIVTLGGVIDVTYLLDTPHAVTWKGVYVDADHRSVETVAGTQNTDDRQKLFTQLSSLQGSILENRVFEDDFKVESISTAKLFQLIHEPSAMSHELILIDRTNIDAVLPTLPFDDNIKEDIANSVNQNYVVRIPKAASHEPSAVSYKDWSGIGYLKENLATGESGWMLSGMIAGGMTVWSDDRWPAYYLERLSNPDSELPSYDPATARFIQKITRTDLQTAFVGAQLAQLLQVVVHTDERRPVAGVNVTFTVRAGGGRLSGTDANGAAVHGTTLTLPTNPAGIASVSLTLGQETIANPVFWYYPETNGVRPYPDQVGENLVDAFISTSGTAIATPFAAYGFPKIEADTPVRIKKLYGDDQGNSIFLYSGFVSFLAEDEYGNPAANIPLHLEVKAPEVDQELPNCGDSAYNQSDKKAYFIKLTEPCLFQAPVWGSCGDTDAQEITLPTTHLGVQAGVILGGTPDAKYEIEVACTSGNCQYYSWACPQGQPCDYQLVSQPSLTLAHHTGYSCGETSLILETINVTDSQGYFVNAQKVADLPATPLTYRATAKLFALSGGAIVTDLQNPSVTFNGIAGTAQGNGIYAADVPIMTVGLNWIEIEGKATIGGTERPAGSISMPVYGVRIVTHPLPVIVTDENGFTVQNTEIRYNIHPADPAPDPYWASTAAVYIYKSDASGDVLVEAIRSEVTGTGIATIGRGFRFDLGRTYKVQVVLNAGGKAEMRSERTVMPVVALKVKNDDDDIAEEIKFGRGDNAKKRYKIELKSPALAGACGNLAGTIRTVNRDNQTASPESGYYPARHNVTFENTATGCIGKINGKDRFIITNMSTAVLEERVGTTVNLNDLAILYGGLGSRIQVTSSNITLKDIPMEPVGIIVLAIDGLRQDVLYPDTMDGQPFESVNDPLGNIYYIDARTLPGLGQILRGNPTESATQRYIMLPKVTAIFPSITLASWASIFTGKMPNETGIVGNEFFARDLSVSTPSLSSMSVPPKFDNPQGIISLSSGAFEGYDEFGLFSGLFTSQFFIPYQLNWENPVDPMRTPQNSRRVLPPDTVFESIAGSPDGQNAGMGNVRSYFSRRGGDSVVVANNHYARGAYWLTWDMEPAWGSSATLDKASWDKLKDYLGNGTITGKYDALNDQGVLTRNTIPFSALTVWYLPGPDHEAHIKGMGAYKDFIKSSTDARIQDVVERLKTLDEFDNKIFIVVADHGHTAMPEDLTFVPSSEPESLPRTAKMDCKLLLDGFNVSEVREAEQANNNLHIWELGEVFKAAGEESGLFYKVLAPAPIAGLFKDKNQNELPYGATADITKANVIAALNGPMAHIYLKSGDDWNNIPNASELSNLAIVFKRMLQEGGVILDDDVKNKFARLLSSLDKLLIRQGGVYKIFNGFDALGNPMPPDDVETLSSSIYVKPVDRITKMNHIDRSGDIVLIFKDITDDVPQNRFTSGVACKSWHGSLSPSDSYVPLIVTYPGGNKTALEPLINGTPGCSTSQGCDGNWRVTDLIQSILQQQY